MELGGKRFYAKSAWESNYAHYLHFLKGRGEIGDWEYEPRTFWFDKIRRGVRSYLPDFRVTLQNGVVQWHEVKGWLDSKSKTKLKRMTKYHPSETVILIGESWFKDANKKLKGLIPGWK